MKHCPHCHGQYRDGLAFCDIDGTSLVDGSGALPKESVSRGAVKTVSAPLVTITAVIGILIGIALCVVVYIAFLTPGLNSNEPSNQHSESPATSAAPALPNHITAAPLPSPSPTAEESPSPESEASVQAAPAAATETSAKIAVNQGPISTGTTTGEGRTLITMKDGSAIEADAAWEDSEGIWYRRSGLVSFVERAKVEKITDLSGRNSPTEAPKP